MRTQNATRYSGVFHFSSAATPSKMAKAENHRSDSTSCPDNARSLQNGSSLSPSALTSDIDEQITSQENAHLASDRSASAVRNADAQIDRRIRIIRKGSGSQRKSINNGVAKSKDFLNGYKYRLLKSPQLTNDSVALPERPVFPTPTPTSSQMIEKEDHDIHQLQQQHANDSMRGVIPLKFPTGTKDVLSLNWWRNLYHNTGNAQTASTAHEHSVRAKQSSLRNRRASPLIVDEVINTQSYAGFLPDERQNHEEEEKIEERIRVRSVQAASSIDVVAVLSKVFGGGVPRASQYTPSDGSIANSQPSKKNQHPLADFFASSPPIRHVFGRTNIIIQLSPPPFNHCPPSLSHSVPRYIAIFRFGSVVTFNLTTKESSRLLEQIKKHSVDPIAVGFERREHFEVALQPRLETATGKISADRAMVRELDMNTVGIVSNIMGQTVALDWHNDTVDELLANFSSVNSSVERTGGFTSMERHTLFQVVARNNSLFIDMVAKLGIKDRSDTAWHLSQYEGLHEGMRKEFDLDERFRNVEFKLDLIQQNAKFFLEVLHAQKSNTLEWVIIVLISFECVLMILDMSGWGTQMLSGLSFSR